MKIALFTLLLVAAAPLAPAHEGHSGSPQTEQVKLKTPNGGRLIASIHPHAEFLVTEAGRIEIRFLEGEQIVAPAGQVVTVITGSRADPTRLAFTVEGDKLVSSGTLPEGKNLPIVLQVRENAEAKPVIERFTLNLAPCPTCDVLEYACMCAH